MGSEDYKAGEQHGKELGELKGEVKVLTSAIGHLTTSFNDFASGTGRRVGNIEVKNSDLNIAVGKIEIKQETHNDDIKELKRGRTFVVITIIGGFITAIWRMMSGK
jgi:hypothetical protein